MHKLFTFRTFLTSNLQFSTFPTHTNSQITNLLFQQFHAHHFSTLFMLNYNFSHTSTFWNSYTSFFVKLSIMMNFSNTHLSIYTITIYTIYDIFQILNSQILLNLNQLTLEQTLGNPHLTHWRTTHWRTIWNREWGSVLWGSVLVIRTSAQNETHEVKLAKWNKWVECQQYEWMIVMNE